MMDFRGFQEYKPGASRYNGRISEDEWNKHKPKLRELHEAKLTRQQILEIMSKDFGEIKPTYGQLCTKFDKWGFHVYRQGQNKATAGNKNQKKTTKLEINEQSIQQAFSPESSNGSTIVPDMGLLEISDKSTPGSYGTPQTQIFDPTSSWSDTATPRQTHSRNVSEHTATPPLGTIYEPDQKPQGPDHSQGYPNGAHTQQWVSATSLTATNTSQGNSSSLSDSMSSRASIYQTVSEINNAEPDDPATIAARTRKADAALDAVSAYLRSLGTKANTGDHIVSMVGLAAYLFATRSYEQAFSIYWRIYEIMCQDMLCNDISRFGALMRCYQSAIDADDLETMQNELHQVLRWNFSDSSLGACVASMLQTVDTQLSEGFNLAQVSILSTSSITRNLAQLMIKGTQSMYPGTRRLFWRLRLLKHSPFHSGCKRLLRLMSELLSWAWAAMSVIKFPEPAIQTSGCLCKDGVYFDFVRMMTITVMEAAVGFDIPQLIKLNSIKSDVGCDCVMCGDLETTFEICPIETFIAIALLTVDRCRLDWTSCHPGGRHQELTPNAILREQLLPTIETLLDQVVADLRTSSTIHTSDLYDDFLSCIWSTFETHDLPLRNARFDASSAKVEDLMTTLITEEMDKSHPARQSTLNTVAEESAQMPTFSYGELANDELASKITAKRTRSNASSLKPSSSNASERSMIRIRKKLKFRGSADYLNSMSSYSSLSSRNSLNRFSLVTGLPELETMMEDDDFDPRTLPPDLTPDEFRSLQRHDSWSRRSDAGHWSWVPSRPGSTASRTMSWRDSATGMPSSRPGSVTQANMLGKRSSQKEAVMNPSQHVIQNQIHGVERALGQRHPYYTQDTRQPENFNAATDPTGQDPAQAPQQFVGRHGSGFRSDFQPQVPQGQPFQPVRQYQTGNFDPGMPPPQVPITGPQPAQPSRKNSGKSTRSKESTKGRWSSEAQRVEKILKMQP